MRLVKNAAITLIVTMALVAAAAGASAESVAVADRTGEAPRAIDITRIRLENAQHAVWIHVHYAHLKRSRVRTIRSELDVGKLLGRGYVIRFKRRASGGFSQRLSWVRLYAEGGSTLPRCAGLRLTWGHDRADLRLPRSCMTKSHDQRVRANATTINRSGKRDVAPGFLKFTDWASRG